MDSCNEATEDEEDMLDMALDYSQTPDWPVSVCLMERVMWSWKFRIGTATWW